MAAAARAAGLECAAAQRQAKERDEEAVQHWVAQEWPSIKKGRRGIGLARRLRRIGHLADPTGTADLVTQEPHSDLAPPMAWKRASMAAALGYRPDGTKARLCFHLQHDAYDTDSLIGVLDQRKGFYAGHQVVLLWDGLSSPWSYMLRAHLDAQRRWLTVERLPASAPELNPVEYLWANLKGGELANCAGDTIAEVADQAQHGSQRVCDSDSLVVGFLAHTGLSLDKE